MQKDNFRHKELILCNCRYVTKSEAMALIEQGRTFGYIVDETDATTGCGTCEEELLSMINNYINTKEV